MKTETQRRPPINVLNSFISNYPSAQNLQWIIQDNCWKAVFEEELHHEIYYNEEGICLKSIAIFPEGTYPQEFLRNIEGKIEITQINDLTLVCLSKSKNYIFNTVDKKSYRLTIMNDLSSVYLRKI